MKDFNHYLNSTGEIGYVEKTTSSIIYVSGLPKAKPGEVVLFETEFPGRQPEQGLVLSLAKDLIEVLIFSDTIAKPGKKVVRTDESLQMPVGLEIVGKIIDPLGNSLETLTLTKKPNSLRPIHTTPSGILTRKTINKHFATGVSIVDLVIPLGYGQRALVIGDRKTGKTNFLLQSVLTQARLNNICIYAAIGKRKIDIKALKEFFTKNEILDRVVIVASASEDPTGIIYLTPYSAMTLSEYFRDEGYDVFLILDDLSTHAKFYREISLVGKRFPGRNSYPGDIFYIHASLLERAGNFTTRKGEKAITCMAVAETTQGDLSGYIQTNLMSMTDGHLYFDSDLFDQGRRPPINPFLSVTRVGKQTQSNLKRQINREILSFMTLFEKMKNFTHFGAELNETTKVTLAVGEALIKFFDQDPSTTIPTNVQMVLFSILWNSIRENKDTQYNKDNVEKIIKAYEGSQDFRKEIDSMIAASNSFNDLLGIIREKKDKLLLTIENL